MTTPSDGVYRIPLYPVSSSNLSGVGYDDQKAILAVEFKSGAIYHYAGVAEDLAVDLFKAESPGRFYNERIKGRFQGQKMTGACPQCGWTGYVGAMCSDCGTAHHQADPPKEQTHGHEANSGADAGGRGVAGAPDRVDG